MSKSKVPYEGKAEIVRGYLEGRVVYTESLGRANNSEASFRYWVHQYQEKGIEELLPSRKNHRYPEEIKRKAVEDYLSGKGSLEQIGGKYGLRSITQLRQWIKVYNAHEDFNFRKNSGGGSYMPQARTRATGDLTMICVMTTASMSMTSGCSASAGSEISVLQSSTTIGAAPDRQRILNILPRIFWTGSFMPQNPTRSGSPM